MKIQSETLKNIIQINQAIWVFSVLFCACTLVVNNPFNSSFIASFLEVINLDFFNHLKGGQPTDVTNFVNF